MIAQFYTGSGGVLRRDSVDSQAARGIARTLEIVLIDYEFVTSGYVSVAKSNC